jgi:hypothetical protein
MVSLENMLVLQASAFCRLDNHVSVPRRQHERPPEQIRKPKNYDVPLEQIAVAALDIKLCTQTDYRLSSALSDAVNREREGWMVSQLSMRGEPMLFNLGRQNASCR